MSPEQRRSAVDGGLPFISGTDSGQSQQAGRAHRFLPAAIAAVKQHLKLARRYGPGDGEAWYLERLGEQLAAEAERATEAGP